MTRCLTVITIEPVYNDIVFYDTSYITSDILWYQLIPHGHDINPLNAELNPICHLPALLGAHHILHVSVIRVKTFG